MADQSQETVDAIAAVIHSHSLWWNPTGPNDERAAVSLHVSVEALAETVNDDNPQR